MVDKQPRHIYDERHEVPVHGKNLLVKPGHTTSVLERRLTSFKFDRYKRDVWLDEGKDRIDTYTLLTPALQRKIASRENEAEASTLVEILHQELTQVYNLETYLDRIDKAISLEKWEIAEKTLGLVEHSLFEVYQVIKATNYFLDELANGYERFANPETDKWLSDIRDRLKVMESYQDPERQKRIRDRIRAIKQKIAQNKSVQ